MNIPVTRHDPERPYWPALVASPGRQVFRVVANMLPCRCRARVITTFIDYTSTQSAVPFELDAVPVPDGGFVIVQNSHGGQAAEEFDAELHAGWVRYAAHRCGGEK